MGQRETVSICFRLWIEYQTGEVEKRDAKIHECLLLLTAALERALGNVNIMSSYEIEFNRISPSLSV